MTELDRLDFREPTKPTMPGEWEPHREVWVAWPWDAGLWREDLVAAQEEWLGLIEAIADVDPDTGLPRGERLRVLVPNDEEMRVVAGKIAKCQPQFSQIPYGDIWLRDTAPIFCRSSSGQIVAHTFDFNGWGGKYILPGDDLVRERVAQAAGVPVVKFPFILEGGAVEVDGHGLLLTTEQCLLNANRYSWGKREEAEAKLKSALGVERVFWLKEGLLNDHTDGHIDTLARFTPGGKILCMRARQNNDPNHAVLERIWQELSRLRTAQGEPFEVVDVPAPGCLRNRHAEVLPASYMNYYVSNTTVVVPTYGCPQDEDAVEIIASCFPGRRILGRPAKAILSGGGAFHCITQQVPRAAKPITE